MVTLRGIRPPIWPRIRVSGHHTQAELHEILQEVMGWTNTHLQQFEIAGRYFVPTSTEDAELDIEGEDESAITLAEAVRLAGKSFRYDYDFGDGWEHTIQVEKVLPAEAQPPMPVRLNRNVPAELERTVMKALEKNRAARDELLISADDAARLGLRTGDAVLVRSTAANPGGALRLRCRFAPVARGTLQAFWPEANVPLPSRLDPASHEPDYNARVVMEKA